MLRMPQEGGAVVAVLGTLLREVTDAGDLDVLVDVLSSDGVRIVSGHASFTCATRARAGTG